MQAGQNDENRLVDYSWTKYRKITMLAEEPDGSGKLADSCFVDRKGSGIVSEERNEEFE